MMMIIIVSTITTVVMKQQLWWIFCVIVHLFNRKYFKIQLAGCQNSCTGAVGSLCICNYHINNTRKYYFILMYSLRCTGEIILVWFLIASQNIVNSSKFSSFDLSKYRRFAPCCRSQHQTRDWSPFNWSSALIGQPLHDMCADMS